MTAQQLFIFGAGYTATPIIKKAQDEGWPIHVTYRSEEKALSLQAKGLHTHLFSNNLPALKHPTHVLISASPKTGCPVLQQHRDWLSKQHTIKTINYLSSTNVYGNHDGGWVTEETTETPSLERGIRRLEAEKNWKALASTINARCGIFRLAGIYGPTRNAIQSILSGKARSIIKPNQVFSRIHVDDICEVVWAFIKNGAADGIYNLADDEPSAPHLVIEEAARLLGTPPPKHEDFDTAEMGEMARSFYLESKKVQNEKIKALTGKPLLYPNYKAGLKALLRVEKARN